MTVQEAAMLAVLREKKRRKLNPELEDTKKKKAMREKQKNKEFKLTPLDGSGGPFGPDLLPVPSVPPGMTKMGK